MKRAGCHQIMYGIETIDKKARKFIIKFVKKKTLIKKAATIGNNIFIINLMNLFIAIVSKRDFEFFSFETKEQAIEWLKKD